MVTHAVLWLMMSAAVIPAGANPTYDAHWTIGDTWSVRYSEKAVGFRAGPPEPEKLAHYVYRYEVVAAERNRGRNVVRVRVDRVERQKLRPQWLMTFDRDEMVLLRIQEVHHGEPRSGPDNPSVSDAWMPHFRVFLGPVIHDFLKLPATATDETRIVTSPGGQELFTQSIVFGPGQVTATLSRTDPAKSVEHKATVVWKAGAKWWSSATITLGGEVQISGVLESVSPGNRGKPGTATCFLFC